MASLLGGDDPYGILGAGGLDPLGVVPDAKFADQLLETLAHGALLPLPAARIARPGDVCFECGRPLLVQEMEYVCPECHAVFEAADIGEVLPVSCPTEPGAGALRGRLRIVGQDSGWYQPDLDRTNPGETSEVQKKTTFAELIRLNKDFEDRGGNPFTRDVLNDVAENYHVIQQTSVKRSMMKRGILAALLFHACIHRGFTRTKAEVAEFAKLQNHGIARGDDYLRAVDEDKGLEIDMNRSRLGPHVVTTFSQLDLAVKDYERHQRAIEAIVGIAEANHIGFKSVLRSKVIAATWEVLRREGAPVTIGDVVEKCHIRKHTIRRFLDDLAEYHSYFAATYRSHGFDSA